MKRQPHRRQRTVVPNKADKPAAVPVGLERLFTVEQIAQLGSRSRASLYLDIKAGRLKARKFGRSTRIAESDYRAYVDSAPIL
ncbi:MAG: helix-turn-helix transcriptional regulator [Xanthobacteraceae bacterium]